MLLCNCTILRSPCSLSRSTAPASSTKLLGPSCTADRSAACAEPSAPNSDARGVEGCKKSASCVLLWRRASWYGSWWLRSPNCRGSGMPLCCHCSACKCSMVNFTSHQQGGTV
jgi:hypothetical protein